MTEIIERPVRSGKAWFLQEDKKLLDTWNKVGRISAVAKYHQRSETAIMARLGKLLSASNENIADASEAPLREHLPVNAGKPWSVEETERIQQMLNHGYSTQRIAISLQRTIGSIRSRISHCQLERQELHPEDRSRADAWA